MKNFYLLSAFLLLCCATAIGQNAWSSGILKSKAFIENKGQFNGKNERRNSQVLYGAETQDLQSYYTSSGLSYRIDQRVLNKEVAEEIRREEASEKKRRRRGEEELEERLYSIKTALVHIDWLNANENAQVLVENELTEYFNYLGKTRAEDVSYAKGYARLVYKNLYQGIDAVYVVDPRGGMKYDLIIQPGADISQIKMRYSGDCKLSIDEKGNLLINTPCGELIDHAPFSFLKDGTTIASSFVLEKNVVSFNLPSTINHYPSAITLDPWVINPNFFTPNKAFDIEADAAGNCYIYGNDNFFKVQKFKPNGAIDWTTNTYATNGWGCGFEADPAGNTYISDGSSGSNYCKLNPSGAVSWSVSGSTFSEAWRLRFDKTYSTLLVGGGAGLAYAANLNPSNGNLTNLTSHTAFLSGMEIRALCSSPNGNFYAMTCRKNNGNTPGVLLGLSPTCAQLFSTSNYFTGSFNYCDPVYTGFKLIFNNAPNPNPQNAIAASWCHIFIYDGDTLHKVDITNGNLLSSVKVAGGIVSMNSGVIADSCGNVYVGTQNGVNKYDQNLNFMTSQSTPGAVYDIAFGLGGTVFAAGDTFVAQLPVMVTPCVKPVLNATSSFNNPSCVGANGTATASPSNGTAPYTYSWSNGQNSQTATGLSAGTYTVTITDASCPVPLTKTMAVTLVSGGSLALANTQSNVLCFGGSSASASVTASSGNTPYTYSWNNGQTNQSASGLSAGTYTVTVTDALGCSKTQSVLITQPAPLTLTGTGGTICEGSSITLTANGGGGTGAISYSWTPGGFTGSSANVAPTSTTSYTVTATDANGCTKTQVITLIVNPRPLATFSADPSSGQKPLNVTFTNGSTGGSTYSWTFGDGGNSSLSNPTHTYLNQGSYTAKLVVTSSAGCKDSISTIIVVEDVSALVIPNVFTPNGDGSNDLFSLQYTGYTSLYLQIYDRWGLEMSTINALSGGWDGKAKSGEDAPAGTYYYILKATATDGKESDMKGFLTLLR